MDELRFYTRQEVAALLRLNVNSVDRLLRQGELRVVKVDRRVLIPKEALDAWIKAHEVQLKPQRGRKGKRRL